MRPAALKRVWVTRTRPGAEITADRVRALGFEPLVSPLLQVRQVGHEPIDLGGVGAIAFTSTNGVEAFTARTAHRDCRVFAVGKATAAAAAAAGFANVTTSEGGVAALAREIAAHRDEFEGTILHPGAAEPAGELSSAGIRIRALTVYETAATPRDAVIQALLPEIHAALIHSAKAARLLAAIMREAPAPNLRLLCLSPAVAAPLSGAISTAAAPTEQALLDLLTYREPE